MNPKLCLLIAFPLLLGITGCTTGGPVEEDEVVQMPADEDYWNNSTIYFLLTDRFVNGDPSNDNGFGRQPDGAPLRSFLGGDLKGITQKINEGYFQNLGVNAIWFNPFFEQIKSSVDEGTGQSYAFHGYWARDWTTLDPNYGTMTELEELVATAHANGIRIVMDVVINHTGPVTEIDTRWPEDWVITGPRCQYQDYESTVTCTLVENLPDIRTDSDEEVGLPKFLRDKWEAEGRLEQEVTELNDFFERTGYPRAPRYYIIKWLTDWVRELGIDAFRMDTAKHFEEKVSQEVKDQAEWAFNDWKSRNPERELPDLDFFMFAEVYNYGLWGGRYYDYGDKKVNYFDYGYNSLINFAFKEDARLSYEEQFRKYNDSLQAGGPLEGLGLVNYLSSHDDSGPYDRERTKPLEAGTRLLLSPGAAQVYYGDETARTLIVPEAQGDAQLRSLMNWEELVANSPKEGGVGTREVLQHWQKLGRFRQAHLSVGAGVHQMRQNEPYLFSRTYEKGDVQDRVLIGLDLPAGEKRLSVFDVFEEGSRLRDAYSGQRVGVLGGEVVVNSPYSVVLLEADQGVN